MTTYKTKFLATNTSHRVAQGGKGVKCVAAYLCRCHCNELDREFDRCAGKNARWPICLLR
jgi:hypothetical protein